MEFLTQPLVQAISVIIIVIAVLVSWFKILRVQSIGCAVKSFGRAWVNYMIGIFE
ncbi:MAG: hypothetical protein ACFFDI_26865 [Promethearchaeota archaeon]